MYHILFIHSSVDGHWGSFFPLKRVNLSLGLQAVWPASLLLSCQVQGSLRCSHHTLLGISFEPLPHWPLLLSLLSDSGVLPSIGGVFQGSGPLHSGPRSFPLHILPQRDKTSVFKRKRNLTKKFLPLETYLGLLSQEMKTTRENDEWPNGTFLDLVNALILEEIRWILLARWVSSALISLGILPKAASLVEIPKGGELIVD